MDKKIEQNKLRRSLVAGALATLALMAAPMAHAEEETETAKFGARMLKCVKDKAMGISICDSGQGLVLKGVVDSHGEFIKGEIDENDGANGWGHFKNGLFNGYGKYTYPSGRMEMGNFVDGKLEGAGTVINEEEKIIHGNFKKGQLVGDAIIEWEDGMVYFGEVANDEPNGKGRMQVRGVPGNGDAYGTFKDGEIVGDKNVFIFWDGRRWEGPIEGPYPHGKGTIEQNGKKREATFKHGNEVKS